MATVKVYVYSSDLSVVIEEPKSTKPLHDATPRVFFRVEGGGFVQGTSVYIDDILVYSTDTGIYGQQYWSIMSDTDGRIIIES